MNKEEENPYLFMTLSMIEDDALDSPYDSFEDYWNDHKDGWSKVLSEEYFEEIVEELTFKYDL